ncbi:MAG: type III polyketide synthase, partial [Bacteroidota bacterium]|nr:type III polyketide synthase [Bacteroidota bacterium]MDX5431465.1 type III polyketide synthase [Bacteroidota bacterium]MDX5470192.1 type III polyketide synthase [Bacteroidota bacterium]
MTKILQIETALPPYRHSQEDISAFMEQTYEKSFAVSKVYQDTSIRSRFSYLKDFSQEDREFFIPGHNPGMAERMSAYFQWAPELAEQAVRKLDGYEEATHLITVSCTGLAAPGLEVILQKRLNLPDGIQKATVNFMGCYAAIHGLRLADWIIRSNPNSKVILVCVELCTLHFQKEYSLDSLTSSSLFGDGAAAVFLGSEGEGTEIKHFFTR